jgi:hypothetical protein
MKTDEVQAQRTGLCTNFYAGRGSDYESITTNYWEVKCTICNQIVNNWEKERAKKETAKAQ